MPALSALSAVLALAVSASALPTGSFLPRNHDGSGIDFKPCDLPKGTSVPNNTLFDCATVSVPTNWSDSSGPSVQFGFSRFRLATPPANVSLGTLVYNCGGPGASCYLSPTGRSGLLYEELLNRGYASVVTIDPRGVGLSSRIKCDPKLYNQYAPIAPQNEAEYNTLVENNVALAKSCYNLTGDFTNNVDTMSVARDLEVLRKALGDDKLNYLGASYGTQIGHTYATLFPSRVGHMVLDGPLDHQVVETQMLEDETRALQVVFDEFVKYCDANSTCALHGQDVRAVWHAALNATIAKPAAANLTECPTCKSNVTYSDVMRTFAGLPLRPSFPTLATAIAGLAKGDGTTFAVSLANGTSDPLYPAFVIQCNDWLGKTANWNDFRTRMFYTSLIGPDVLQSSQSWLIQATCINWPFTVRNPPQAMFVDPSAAPALIVASLKDPSTSFTWGIGIRHQYPSSRIVFRDGIGHTAFGRNGTTTRVIMDFLTGGPIPEADTVYPSTGELY